jgi:PPM family protein phosphatase
VQTLVDGGLISAEEARRHPRRNLVLQAVEGSSPPEPDLALVDVRVGDRLLVCSDGLTDVVDDDTARDCLERRDPAAAAEALVNAAVAAGGRDNVTCLVSDVVDGPRVQPDGVQLGAFRDPYLVVDPAAVHAAQS